jgi:integrase
MTHLLNTRQTANILGITITLLSDLVNTGKVPYTKIQTNGETSVKFNPCAIENWIAKLSKQENMKDDKYNTRLKKRFDTKYTKQLKILKKLDEQFKEPRVPKGYNLVKVPNKKLGFVFYVRYIENGKLVYSRWCTHTNNIEAAKRFAIENRETILEKYYNRNNKPRNELYSILKRYYAENSPYLETDRARGRLIGEKSRLTYHNFIHKQFIPYLKKYRIKNIEQIDTPFMYRFQNYLLLDIKKKDNTIKRKGIKAQTINHYIMYINNIFKHLVAVGDTKNNPCKNLSSLPETNVKTTGCYEIDKLKGAWNKKWENDLSYMLTLIMHTTNMRNSEIERIRMNDFFIIDKCHFLNISDSKSKNGIRVIPIHDILFKKAMSYARKYKKSENDFIFKLPTRKKNGSDTYKAAYLELGKYIGYTVEQMNEENIRFYSGRHFWKTLMNANDLGDIEEYFMGHKTSGNVNKNYNHKDKIGRKKLLEKTKKVFAILDKHIFIRKSLAK